MGKLKSITLGLLASLLLVACENENPGVQNTNQSRKEDNISKIALKFANGINASTSTQTRSIDLASVKTINKLPMGNFFKNESNTRAVNYQIYLNDTLVSTSLTKNEGTVILIKNGEKILPIAYFRKENNMDVNKVLRDTTSDLSFLLQTAVNNIADDSSPMIENTDQIVEKVNPKCKVSWDQDPPYNKYCYTNDGQQALAGCVAIAGAQALSVLRPKMSMITSWDEVTKQYPTAEAIDEIAKLISYVGQQTGMKYGTKASGTKTSNLVDFFKKYDIYNWGTYQPITVLHLPDGIVVVSGYRAKHGWGPWKHYVDGHAFIADGYVKYNRPKDPYYLHLNYGWGEPFKDVYLLSSEKEWKENEAMAIYKKIFPHKIDFFCFAHEHFGN
ncbi:C10 family peptidase [Prevotella cerevisiae]|uniref:C10 family peptidase n=1 Tax=Segatella cerevisiae TaxID=2053716 RepID=A0ABT1BYI6_9BACT|nr:C10 family peptidase [Segatella cerevisiae]MCO6026139.1 C10 family peptidase [Segatella cerevisiae]